MSDPINIGDSRVIESREAADGVSIRRRREAPDGRRFTTYERIEKPNIVISKKDGSLEIFDRVKLLRGVSVSVGKFFSSEVEIEKIVTEVEDALYALGESQVASKRIGELVLESLKPRNEVAYVRFASVYFKFKTLDEFRSILDQAVKSKNKDK